METTSVLEECRVALQAELDAAKTQKERNQLGQFATPTGLALDILGYAHEHLPKKVRVRFLDPAIGTGSFYSALLALFGEDRIERALGFEIDRHYGEPARLFWKHSGLDLRLRDFAAERAGEQFNLVICNPPYVRHHHLSRERKAKLHVDASRAAGVPIGGLAGLYCYFLGLAHDWLAPDGLAGWLVPSEFMDVNYGVPLKRYLLSQVEVLAIHRFDPDDLQFGDALVSSAVLWFRKRRPAPDHKVTFSFGGTLARPRVSKRIRASELSSTAKWTGLASNGVRMVEERARLGDFFSIKRGLATGDNRFFILTREQIAEHGLPLEAFTPILPGPRHISADIVEGDSDGVPELERRLFMLNCRLPENEIAQRYPSLHAYLQSGKPQVSDTYLCRHRSPWYAQENRPAPPFLCTYMGRGLERREKPFRFILNRSRATAANVYLLLYPKAVLAKALAERPGLDKQVWGYLNCIPSALLLGEGRVYGGGLYKMEPKELANVSAMEIADMAGIGAVEKQASLFGMRAA
jgi:adenine-specific DNA-methyltransferase